jgi:hypothetical protein
MSSANGGACTSVRRVHRERARALEFPRYYGRNRDALFDCLSDFERSPEKSYILGVLYVDRLWSEYGDTFRLLTRMLGDTARNFRPAGVGRCDRATESLSCRLALRAARTRVAAGPAGRARSARACAHPTRTGSRSRELAKRRFSPSFLRVCVSGPLREVPLPLRQAERVARRGAET